MQARNLLIYFHYLDKLAKLGVTNMRKADIYLEGRFLLEPREAEEILDAWFNGYGKAGGIARPANDAEFTQLLRR
jgi:hypothetical protein